MSKTQDETWGDFLNRCVDHGSKSTVKVDSGEIANKVVERLESQLDASVVESAARDGVRDALEDRR